MLRTAQAMTASGYLAAGIVGAIFFRDFATRAVPVLSEYCQDRVSFRYPFLCTAI